MTPGLDIYNDLEAYDTMLTKTMQEAEEILSMQDRALSDLEREKLKKDYQFWFVHCAPC